MSCVPQPISNCILSYDPNNIHPVACGPVKACPHPTIAVDPKHGTEAKLFFFVRTTVTCKIHACVGLSFPFSAVGLSVA